VPSGERKFQPVLIESGSSPTTELSHIGEASFGKARVADYVNAKRRSASITRPKLMFYIITKGNN